MTLINPYLNFNGTTEEAFNFYRSVFGGEFAMLMRFGDSPEAEKASPEAKNKIMHIALPIGNGNVLMGTDALESMGQKLVAGNNFHLTVHADSRQDADKFYNGLSAGGKATMPMQDTFWGSYYGMLTDKFGTNWMISFDQPKA